MSNSSDNEEMNNVHAWEKIAHCPECGHTKCEKCIGERVDQREYMDDWEKDYGPVPKELHDKAIHCCECDEFRALLDWIAPESPSEWSDMTKAELDEYFGPGGFDKLYDHRVADRKTVSQAEFEREQIAKQLELEQERKKGRGKPGAYEEWLAGWTQDENGRWTNHNEDN